MNEQPPCFTPLDPGRVNVTDVLELRYWCVSLQCSEAELEEAMTQVGPHVAELRPFLESRRDK